ncbi:MAG: hypothetical protein PHQ43_09270 [Dehalococcoidales bacterium]|nr:hypothetical protein [Dehalococcoidales bacterium]
MSPAIHEVMHLMPTTISCVTARNVGGNGGHGDGRAGQFLLLDHCDTPAPDEAMGGECEANSNVVEMSSGLT